MLNMMDMLKDKEDNAFNPPHKMSAHFYYSEFIRSETATRDEIDNNCYDPVKLEMAQRFAEEILEKIRTKFGSFRPNSWYRCEELERRLTRSGYASFLARRNLSPSQTNWDSYFKNKQHPKGWAADVEVTGHSNDAIFAWCKENLEYDQLIREFGKKGQPYSGWVHISWNPEGDNRKQAFDIN